MKEKTVNSFINAVLFMFSVFVCAVNNRRDTKAQRDVSQSEYVYLFIYRVLKKTFIDVYWISLCVVAPRKHKHFTIFALNGRDTKQLAPIQNINVLIHENNNKKRFQLKMQNAHQTNRIRTKKKYGKLSTK